MPDNEEQKLPIYDSKLVQLIATVYGPYAFGVASLLIIWYTIVSPQLARQTIDHQANIELVKSLSIVVQTSETTSRTLERTTVLLEAMIQQLKDQQ
jgi:hypothetical protein